MKSVTIVALVAAAAATVVCAAAGAQEEVVQSFDLVAPPMPGLVSESGKTRQFLRSARFGGRRGRGRGRGRHGHSHGVKVTPRVISDTEGVVGGLGKDPEIDASLAAVPAVAIDTEGVAGRVIANGDDSAGLAGAPTSYVEFNPVVALEEAPVSQDKFAEVLALVNSTPASITSSQ